jgi:GntR family transcriptional regulator / MocR family aminotransferase
MKSWDLVLPVERDGDSGALFLQIARAIAEHIRRGRLRPGEPLPGTRSLAGTLGVHRNTVIAAFQELTAEGWITTSPARGTFVSSDLPDPVPQPGAAAAARALRAPSVPYPLRAGPTAWSGSSAQLPASGYPLIGGKPDVSLVPTMALARAYRRTLQRHGGDVLGYGDPRGHERLRAAIAAMLASTRGVAASAEDVVITRGSQMALFLIARTLLGPGDVVAVEGYGYVPAWEALKSSGATLAPLPVDGAGVIVDALEELAAKHRVRAIYLTPHHQYPTTVSLSPGRRIQLMEFVRRRKMVVIEDDYDHEFHYEGRPILPLASADATGTVVYLGTLSKVLAPGVRIGYVVAPPPVVALLAANRAFIDINGDLAMESAIAELFEDGEVQRHVSRARRIYRARRDSLVEALRTHLGDALSFTVPNGGIAMWCRTARGIAVEPWMRRCAEAGVRFHAGGMFSFDGRSLPYVRLGFAALPEKQLHAAAKIMAAKLRG